MITLSSAENVLKDVYLGVLQEQINTKTNPLFSRIKRSTKNIVGKEIRLVAPIGINGGIMAGDETSDLPEAAERPFVQFIAPLKNLYGRFEISDKAVQCSSTDVNSFINLVEDGMDSLIKASAFNLSRMIYGDGTGRIAKCLTHDEKMYVDNIEAFAEGMYIDVMNDETFMKKRIRVTYVDKVHSYIENSDNYAGINDLDIYVSGSRDHEITGLKGIANNKTLYGNVVENVPQLKAKIYSGDEYEFIFDDAFVQQVIDDLEKGGTNVNFINTSFELKKVYLDYMTRYNKNVEFTKLENGMIVPTHHGIPMVPTGMIGPKESFFLNTNDFTFYELGDWRWLEDESGRVLKQVANKPVFGASLVKYTELICQKPSGLAYCKSIPNTIPE